MCYSSIKLLKILPSIISFSHCVYLFISHSQHSPLPSELLSLRSPMTQNNPTGTFQFLSVQSSSRHILKHTRGDATNLQPSSHCFIMQLKLLFMELEVVCGLPTVHFSHLNTFGSFHIHHFQQPLFYLHAGSLCHFF